MGIALKISLTMGVLALLFACTPKVTGRKLYLYVSQRDKAMFSDTVAEASKEARKNGAELVFASLDSFLSRSTNDVLKPMAAGDALAVVVYQEDWSPRLEIRLKALWEELREPKNGAVSETPEVAMGLWLMDQGRKPKFPETIQDWASQGLDAISSASAERPSKVAAKNFFESLLK